MNGVRKIKTKLFYTKLFSRKYQVLISVKHSLLLFYFFGSYYLFEKGDLTGHIAFPRDSYLVHQQFYRTTKY